MEGEGTYLRTVAETATAGQLVGDPVTAEDDNPNDVLTYTLVVDGSDNFVIDRATGQISVAKGAEFDVTADVVNIADVARAQNDAHTVTVIATDPTGVPPAVVPADEVITAAGAAYATVEVTINVTQVDEPPIFTVMVGGSPNVAKVVAVSFEETTGNIADALATFMANDPDLGGTASAWDQGRRQQQVRLQSYGWYVLMFKAAAAAAPNFEKPADADKDNVYEVTITATDGNANMATRDVKVTVTNAEEAGTVKLSQPRPRAGLAMTASYSDPDGGLASAEWQWWRTVANELDEPDATVPTLTQAEVVALDADTTTGK